MNIHKHTLAIDLGSQNIRVFSRNGLVFDEPALIVREKGSQQLIAIGQEAEEYLYSKDHTKTVVSPLSKGKITNVEATELLLKHALRRSSRRPFLVRPRVMINSTSSATSAERRAITDACEKANIGSIHFIENTLAGAIGSGLPISDSRGYGVLDIGHEKIECSVFALGARIGHSYSGYGGKDIISFVSRSIRQKYGLKIGDREIKQLIAHDHTKPRYLTLWGVDASGRPASQKLSTSEVDHYRGYAAQRIANIVQQALDDVSADIISDLFKTGITMTGGVAAMPKLEHTLKRKINIPFYVSANNTHAVCKGAFVALTHLDDYEQSNFGT